jgi:hypothetical protein
MEELAVAVVPRRADEAAVKRKERRVSFIA